MKYKIKLGHREGEENTRPWWINFFSSIPRNTNNLLTLIEQLNKELVIYNARLIFYEPDQRYVLEFDSEEDFLYFKLRWS